MIFAATSSKDSFVDLDISVLAWLVLGGIVTLLIAFDLWRHRDDHEPTTKEAAGESIFYVAIGLLFGAGLAYVYGSQAFGEYISGYVIEKSLSVDNVFIWAIIFSSLAIPLKYQHRVLFWGIFGALVFRGIFVFAGSALITKFWWMLLGFGILLIFSGIKIFRHRDQEEEMNHDKSLKFLKRFIPITDQYDGHRFITKIDGVKMATPLLAALVVVELTDIIFAVDSVPAILAVSREPYLVIAANAFAILGLRALYFLLANAKSKFPYLSHALGAILVFVGFKMSFSHWYHLPTIVSLLVIFVLLFGAIGLSIWKLRNDENSTKVSP
ncbi:MAG: TerC family protein [Ilumatobacteraceae bacterium]|jgi:tellurite resistance protein TerC|nr:TerC family protein [Ilumatobacteraceae bacterium]